MKNSFRIFLKIIMAVGFLIGLAILFYPWFSNKWNQYNDKLKFQEYQQAANEKFVDEGLVDEWERAHAYNEALSPIIIPDSFIQTEGMTEEDKEYMSCLNINEDGMMGYIYIPKIGERIPIYHTTSEDVLQNGAGHIQGSSLPVGGEGTHSAIAAHRGLPGASLFTDIDQLEEGDQFFLYILDDVLAYEVDQILTVEPSDTEALGVEEGKDYVTLVTCTPYGINSHRLLVRGHRVPYEEEQVVVEETKVVQSVHTNYFMWIGLGLGITAVCMAVTLLIVRLLRNKNRKDQKLLRAILPVVLLLSLLMSQSMDSYAAENVDVASRCSVSLEIPSAYREELKAQSIEVRLYRIAEITEYGRYRSVPGYEDLYAERLSTATTAEELEALARKAASYLRVSDWEQVPKTVPSYELTITQNEGSCSNMEAGLYLVCVRPVRYGNATYRAIPYIISLPTLIETEEDGVRDLKWSYDLTIDLKLGCERDRPTPVPSSQPTESPVPESSPEPSAEPSQKPSPIPAVSPKASSSPSPTIYPSPWIEEEDGVLWEYFYDENGVLGRRRYHRTGDDSSFLLTLIGAGISGFLFLLLTLLKNTKRKNRIMEDGSRENRGEGQETYRITAGDLLRYILGFLCMICLAALILICVRYYEMRKHNDTIKEQVLTESAESSGESFAEESDPIEDYCQEKGLPIVDFAALKEVNQDCVAWIYACDGKISYPVVASTDEYYLTHAVDGVEAKSGAIYVDSTQTDPFEKGRAVVYGHHMRDGSMFQPLMKYWQDKDYREKCRNIYIITETKVYEYEISDIYVKEYEELDFTEAQDDLQKPVIDLVTCEYSGNDTRLVIEAVQQ